MLILRLINKIYVFKTFFYFETYMNYNVKSFFVLKLINNIFCYVHWKVFYFLIYLALHTNNLLFYVTTIIVYRDDNMLKKTTNLIKFSAFADKV